MKTLDPGPQDPGPKETRPREEEPQDPRLMFEDPRIRDPRLHDPQPRIQNLASVECFLVPNIYSDMLLRRENGSGS